VLFGHGDNFSRGIDVDASQAAIIAGRRTLNVPNVIDPLGKTLPHRTKPIVVSVHGDTWNLGHELYLASDIRIAAADTRFGQDENTHGRFPGGGATIRFVAEAGWGNAMRYMLTGDHWTAEESLRMRAAVDQGDAAIGAPGRRPDRGRRAVKARRRVRRALSHGRLRRGPPRRGRRPAAEIPGQVVFRGATPCTDAARF
jgi:enoyl-CoA hydratase/carnithine racemase